MWKMSGALAGLVLSGCVANQGAQPQINIEQAMQACQRPKRSHVEVAVCQNQVFHRVAGQSANSDLVNLATAKNLVVAEKLDRHEITEAEGQLELAQSATAITSEVGRRQGAAASEEAAEESASAARAQAVAEVFQRNRPPSPQPVYQPIVTAPQAQHCVTNLIGNTAFTNCH